MRKTLILLATLAAACSSATEIRPKLPAVVTVSYGDAGDSLVTTSGDSVVARATLGATCGGTYSVAAAMLGNALRIVVTDSLPAPIPCAMIFRYRTIRAAVAGAPHGSYPVELDLRSVVASSVSESVVMRQRVSLP